jgi:Protein of unknown function (DUF1236)
MKTLRLLSTTAAVLLLGAGAVSAQGMKNDEAPARAPAAQQNAPAEKMAPAMKSEQRKAPETTGQAAEPESDKKQLKTQKMDKGAPANPAAKGSSDADGNANVRSKSTSESGAGAASSPNRSADERKRSTTDGQGAAAGSANLTSEQHTKITGIIRQHKVAPTQLNVSVRVGTRIPDSVRFYPLPREVFVIYPEWRGYEYIMVGNEILVIDPRTHQIVAILEA